MARTTSQGAWVSAAFNESEYANGEFDGNRLPGTPQWIFSFGTRYEHEPTGRGLRIGGFYVDS